MKLYHGSTHIVENPIILDVQRMLDFGKGFYTTTCQEQAEKWALIKQKREDNNSKAIVNVYEIDIKLLANSVYNIKIFNQANEEWLDFIVGNRSNYSNHAFDIVKGAVANDTLYRTLSLYESGILTKLETITRLKIHVLFDQISFHNQNVLKELIYTEFYELL
jgi:Protein of unknown function (DUF3990)